MKICPVCKSRCFDDMDTCYGCMHNFNNEIIAENSIEKTQKIVLSSPESIFDNSFVEDEHIPEFFEIDSFPYIEDDWNNNFIYNETLYKTNNYDKDKLTITIELPKAVIEKYVK